MEKEFIPMDLALRLKALGFDEPCFAGFNPTPFDYDDLENLIYPTIRLNFDGEDIIYNDFQTEEPNIWTIDSDVILAPTWQQAFRWFREKYDLHAEIVRDKENSKLYVFFITNSDDIYPVSMDFSDGRLYEEAEIACLTKLIEIVENEKTL
jgi:hypothetical protein